MFAAFAGGTTLYVTPELDRSAGREHAREAPGLSLHASARPHPLATLGGQISTETSPEPLAASSFRSTWPSDLVPHLPLCTIELWCWPAFSGAAGGNLHCEYSITGSVGGTGRCRGESKPCADSQAACWHGLMCAGATWQTDPPDMPAAAYLASYVTVSEATCESLRDNCQTYPLTSCYLVHPLGVRGLANSNTVGGCLNSQVSIGVTAPGQAAGWNHAGGCPW